MYSLIDGTRLFISHMNKVNLSAIEQTSYICQARSLVLAQKRSLKLIRRETNGEIISGHPTSFANETFGKQRFVHGSCFCFVFRYPATGFLNLLMNRVNCARREEIVEIFNGYITGLSREILINVVLQRVK